MSDTVIYDRVIHRFKWFFFIGSKLKVLHFQSQTFKIQNLHCYRKNKKFTIGQKISLVMLAAADFMSFCSMSIMAPFYPKEAASKGMTEAVSGFIFGYYALVIFISSPIFGKIVRPQHFYSKCIHFKCVFITVTKSWCKIHVYKWSTSFRFE